jgi:hypothetical protein
LNCFYDLHYYAQVAYTRYKHAHMFSIFNVFHKLNIPIYKQPNGTIFTPKSQIVLQIINSGNETLAAQRIYLIENYSCFIEKMVFVPQKRGEVLSQGGNTC